MLVVLDGHALLHRAALPVHLVGGVEIHEDLLLPVGRDAALLDVRAEGVLDLHREAHLQRPCVLQAKGLRDRGDGPVLVPQELELNAAPGQLQLRRHKVGAHPRPEDGLPSAPLLHDLCAHQLVLHNSGVLAQGVEGEPESCLWVQERRLRLHPEDQGALRLVLLPLHGHHVLLLVFLLVLLLLLGPGQAPAELPVVLHHHLAGAGLGGEDGAKVQELQLLVAGDRRVGLGGASLRADLDHEVIPLADDEVQRVHGLAGLVHSHGECQLKRLLWRQVNDLGVH
mmetsp:Transcript_24677/g.58580  ORF Transcript_24677/g.58580 Transcript_24677/m.58580 type:complete len:283 (+) Transcript_24677:506-1354(+)